MVAVSDGPYRLILRSPGDRVELYDRAVDPTEQTDIGSAQPEVLKRLTTLAQDYLEQSPVWGDTPDVELGEAELEQLRALGYVVE